MLGHRCWGTDAADLIEVLLVDLVNELLGDGFVGITPDEALVLDGLA
jgi:hypothetical protein